MEENRDKRMAFAVSKEEKLYIEDLAEKTGCSTVSEFLRNLVIDFNLMNFIAQQKAKEINYLTAKVNSIKEEIERLKREIGE